MFALLRRIWFLPLVVGTFLVVRHIYLTRRVPPLWSPRTINDKVLYRMVFDRRPILPRIIGKLEVRDHVLARTGDPDLLVDMVGTASNGRELAALDLPRDFIVKANHLSGFHHVHRGPEPPDLTAIAAKVTRWSSHIGWSEWAYSQVRHTCIVEHLMLQDGQVPDDYKIFCFDGRVYFVLVTTGRFSEKCVDIFRPAWTWIDARHGKLPNAERPPPRPERWAAMIALAETLSYGLDFVRVDLYQFNGRIKVGELTVYSDRATVMYSPAGIEDMLGAPWVLPKRGRLGKADR